MANQEDLDIRVRMQGARQAQRDAARVGQGVRDIGDGAQDANKKSGKFFDSVGKGFDAMGGVAAAGGAAAGALFATSLSGAMFAEAANSRLKAQLGLTAEEAERTGKIAGDLYKSNFGESIEDVNDALKNVIGNIGGMREASDKTLSSVTGDVINLAKTFDQDFGSVANGVSQMIRTGLAKDAREALNLLTVGFQNGANKADDLLDTVNEYGTQFRKVGIDGSTAMGLISQGIQGGARDADIVADAIKEFSIRAIDGSETTKEGFDAIGLSAGKMADLIASGGPGAKRGLDQVLDRLRSIKDPVRQSAAAVALFGTQAEDLGQALYSLDPSEAVTSLGKVSGAAKQLGDDVNNNAAARLESFKRKVLGGLTEFIGGTVIPFVEKNSEVFGLLAVVAGTLAVAIGVVTAALWLMSLSPVVLIIAAITAAIAALVYGVVWAYKNFDKFREVVDKFAEHFKTAMTAVINFFIDRINNFIDIINFAIKAYNKLPFGKDMKLIGKIEHVGGGPTNTPAPPARAATTRADSALPHGAAGNQQTPRETVVNTSVQIDGREVAKAVTRNAKQKQATKGGR